MYGEYQIKLDLKGRFFLPKHLRDEMNEDLMLMRMQNYIIIMKKRAWEQLEVKVRNTENSRLFYARSTECQIDSHGRILISQYVRTTLKLKNDIAVIGKDNTIEVWDLEEWQAYSKNTPTTV